MANTLHDLKLRNLADEQKASQASAETAAANSASQSSATANRNTTTVEHVVNVPDLTVGGKKLSRFTKVDAEELARLIASSPSAANTLANAFVQVLQTAGKNAAG